MADHSSFSSPSSNDASLKSNSHQLQSSTDQSDSSTLYEESWPHVATPPVHVVTMGTSDTPVIAQYIQRFRTTPPTSREGRPLETDGQFWWKKNDKKNRPIRVMTMIIMMMIVMVHGSFQRFIDFFCKIKHP